MSGYHPITYNCRKTLKGGGVGFYIKKELSFNVIDDLSIFQERIFESKCIEVEYPSGKVLFISIYRPPGNHPYLTNSQLLAAFQENLEFIFNKVGNRNCYILTDSNIDLLAIDRSSDSLSYFDSCMSNGFLNLITRATRFTTHSNTLIDQIMSNVKSKNFTSGVLLTDLSDHLPNFTCLNFKKPAIPKPKEISYRNFSSLNIELFKENLGSLSFNEVLACTDPQVAFDIFWDRWKLLFDLHFPLVSKKFNRNFHKIHGFMSNGILISRRKKLSLYNEYLSSRDINKFTEYKQYRNVYNSVIRLAKKLYYEKKVNDNKSNVKNLWKTLNQAIERDTSKSSVISNITINGTTITESDIIANEFNTFFSQVAGKIKSEIPPTTAKPEDYLNELDCRFDIGITDKLEIIEVIRSLESKATLDIDSVSTILLKKVAEEICTPLEHIFNLSFATGELPSNLKVSRTCPIYKADLKDNMNNYRPISCLPALSKVIEKIVHKRLVRYLKENDILYDLQFGFQKGKSTTQPLLNIINYISNAFNNNEIVVGVFLDLRKAFDLVDHGILAKKLEAIGIKDRNLKWFMNYLKDRKQYVMVNGCLSSFFTEMNVSVAQGSILGVILFLIFINDLFKSNDLLNFLFADDTSALKKGSDIVEIGNFINTELQKIGMWLRANKLAINSSKTKVIVFHPKNKNIPTFPFVFNENDINGPQNPDLIHSIERITNFSKIPAYKMLGVFLDENLTFEYHIAQTRNKVSKALFPISKAKNFLSTEALKSLYYGLIHPHFIYCLPIYSCGSKKSLDTLNAKYKQCIRTITKSKYNAHTDPLYHSTRILPFYDLIIFNNLLLIHSIDKGYSTVSYNNLIYKHSNLNLAYSLRNSNEYIMQRVDSVVLRRFPFYTFPKLWNELANTRPELTSTDSKSIFKFNLKMHLLNKYADFRCEKLYCWPCSQVDEIASF